MRLGRAEVVSLTLLQLLEAFEGNLELVRRVKLGGVVLDLDAEERNDRHGGTDELKCVDGMQSQELKTTEYLLLADGVQSGVEVR